MRSEWEMALEPKWHRRTILQHSRKYVVPHTAREYCFIPSSNLCLKRSTLSFFFSPTCARTSWCETLWVRRHPLLVGHFSHSGTPEAKHRCGFNRSWCLNPLFSRTEDSQFSPSMFSWVLCSPAVSCVTQHKHH